MPNQLTVLDVLSRVFPRDSASSQAPYLAWPGAARRGRGGERQPFEYPPLLPFDLFAMCAHLLELSGAYHHICARPDSHDGPGQLELGTLSHRDVAKRRVDVSRDEIASCRRVARLWRDVLQGAQDRTTVTARLVRCLNEMEADGQSGLLDRWRRMLDDHSEAPIYHTLTPTDDPPAWWRIAHELFMIADEACAGVGFSSLLEETEDNLWFENFRMAQISSDTIATNDEGEVILPTFTSLSAADPDVVCVLPKGRTTPVGCTLRSLSHHLALLPPQGIARGRWFHPAPGQVPTDDTELNFLLVPFPYEVPGRAFASVASGSRSRSEQNWGFFHVRQTWLPDPHDGAALQRAIIRLDDFIAELVGTATTRHGARSIDAIIFPELALTYEIYRALSQRLKISLPALEFFVAGLSSDETGRQGNYVATTIYSKQSQPDEDDFATRFVRQKHHRWKMDRGQLESYHLDGSLNPRFQWWEDIDLLSRSIDFAAFRKRSVMATMICEDLARVDPCQELLRAVGPNLIIALLMDAPQLKDRWPARYATVLAEDPGSSVLTLTSKALMNRQHRLGSFTSKTPDDRVIALWRDDHHGRPIPIHCPDHCQAVWLKTWTSQITDSSLDGRDDPHGKTWTYGRHYPISLDNAGCRYQDVLTSLKR